VTINTDNRLMSATSMSHEMNELVRQCDWTFLDLQRATINALKSAFIPFEERLEIIEEIEESEEIKVSEYIEIDEHFEYGIGLEAALYVEALEDEVIEKFINDFNTNQLTLDPSLYSFRSDDEEE
jgi:hypothetical protein